MKTPRVQGELLSPSRRLALAAALRKLWAKDPSLTIEQVMEQAGVSRNFASDFRRRLVAEGRLEPHQHTRRNLAPKLGEPSTSQGAGEAASVPSLADKVLRETCPRCMCAGGECDRCNGTGYIFKDPYDTRTSGEQRDDFADLPEVAHGG